jgi:hypothetical protein
VIDRSPRRSAAGSARLLTAVLVVVVASACSGGDDTPPTTTTTTTAVPVLEVPAVPLTEAYFGALGQLLTADSAVSAVSAAALPDSEAALFADHQATVRRLLELVSPRTVSSVTVPPGTPTAVEGGFELCEVDGACVVYDAVVTDPTSGQVVSFSIDGSPLTGRIAGAGPESARDGIVTHVSSASVSIAGEVLVVLESDNITDTPVELFGFAAVLQPIDDAGNATGASVEATGTWGVATVEPGTIGELMVTFPGSVLGGRLRLSGLRGDGLDVSLDIEVPTG